MSQKSCTLVRNGTRKNFKPIHTVKSAYKRKGSYLKWLPRMTFLFLYFINVLLQSSSVFNESNFHLFNNTVSHVRLPRDGFDYCNLIMLREPYSSLLLPIILLQISYCAENAINHIRLCQKLGLMQNHSFIRRNLGESGLQTSSMTK